SAPLLPLAALASSAPLPLHYFRSLRSLHPLRFRSTTSARCARFIRSASAPLLPLAALASSAPLPPHYFRSLRSLHPLRFRSTTSARCARFIRSARSAASSLATLGRRVVETWRVARTCEADLMLEATLLALGSAALHAAWNLLVKTSEDRFLAAWGQFLVGGLLFVPWLALTGLPGSDAWPYLGASSVVHVL